MINYVKNTTTDQEVVQVKELLGDSRAKDFKKYVMNEIAFHQAIGGKEASLNRLESREWEANQHISSASELITFIKILNEYSKPEKELYKLSFEIDPNLE